MLVPELCVAFPVAQRQRGTRLADQSRDFLERGQLIGEPRRIPWRESRRDSEMFQRPAEMIYLHQSGLHDQSNYPMTR